jgi:hypothetical protein
VSSQLEQREVGLLFTEDLVLAIAAGRKTRTMRPITPRNSLIDGYPVSRQGGGWSDQAWKGLDWNDYVVDPGPSPAGNPGPYLKVAYPAEQSRHRIYCRHDPGDLLIVRETMVCDEEGDLYWAADGKEVELPEGFKGDFRIGTIPSIHMRAALARFRFPIVRIFPQRPFELTEDEAKAEGFEGGVYQGTNRAGEPCETRHRSALEAFRAAFGAMYGPESIGHQWCWVYDWAGGSSEVSNG